MLWHRQAAAKTDLRRGTISAAGQMLYERSLLCWQTPETGRQGSFNEKRKWFIPAESGLGMLGTRGPSADPGVTVQVAGGCHTDLCTHVS